MFVMHSRLARHFALMAWTGIAVLGVWPTPLAAETPATRRSSASLPRTKADAEKWLRERGHGSGADSLALYLGLASNWSADVVRMMLLSGASATKPDRTGDYPLSALATSCDGQPAAAAIGELLLQAGASVEAVESMGGAKPRRPWRP